MNIQKKPPWLRIKLPSGKKYGELSRILNEKKLNTVCQEAKCPNIGECFSCGKATFMIMGNICTRNCRFCAVSSGTPAPLNEKEPQEVAMAIVSLKLSYSVITSVTRDDLPDGGAEHFAKTVEAIRKHSPETKIEVLIPDFQGDEDSLKTVIHSKPHVLNHNIETVPELYDRVRPQAIYSRSVNLIKKAREIDPSMILKSGIMIGIGEKKEEIMRVIKDLINAGCDMLTIGQYLAPSKEHLQVERYVTPEEFDLLKKEGEKMGMKKVISGPLIRSSYYRSDTL